ncbi:hypothetical protein [Vibrio harveyi]|uniref:hypothetical protein n=1 Tax=Vibrio harveyi TaxID=669 RepID=UPI00248174D6|nr:hypothetical protein [Vibrio harveyi]
MTNAMIKELVKVIPDECIEKEFETSSRTSIYRKVASLPVRILLERGLISGSVLNFGKGKYDIDSDTIRAESKHRNCSDYDYTFARNTDLLGCHFDTVVAAYVVNTLPPISRSVVWSQIASVTDRNGTAYIAARSIRDKHIKGEPYKDGVRTSVGTFQIGYADEQLLGESRQHFKHTRILVSRAAFVIVECRHTPFND